MLVFAFQGARRNGLSVQTYLRGFDSMASIYA
jgi:hypothetical protein